MDQPSVVFPAALALGLTDAPDEDDVMWEDFFEEAQLHAGHDDTADSAGTTRKGRRGGWCRSFKRTPHASKKYEQNRYEYKESPWWKTLWCSHTQRVCAKSEGCEGVPTMLQCPVQGLWCASAAQPGAQLALQGHIRSRGEEGTPKNPCGAEDHGGALLSEGEC